MEVLKENCAVGTMMMAFLPSVLDAVAAVAVVEAAGYLVEIVGDDRPSQAPFVARVLVVSSAKD